MNENSKNYQILHHTIKYCEKIHDVIKPCKGKYNTFMTPTNYATRDACCFYLLQIGELTGNLTDDFKKKHSVVPWKEIKSLRNIVAHRYGTVEFDTIWEILTEDVPTLNKNCREILSQYNPYYEEKLQNELDEEIGMKSKSHNLSR